MCDSQRPENGADSAEATGIDRERILERVGVYVDTLDRSCSQCGGTYTVRDHGPHQCP